jgi:hypothetical protein
MARQVRITRILRRHADMEPDGTVTPVRRYHARANGYDGPLTREEVRA